MSELYMFDGQPMTIAQIHARVPALSTTTIRRRLREGRCTAQTMLAFDTRCALRRAGKKTAKRRQAMQARGTMAVQVLVPGGDSNSRA